MISFLRKNAQKGKNVNWLGIFLSCFLQDSVISKNPWHKRWIRAYTIPANVGQLSSFALVCTASHSFFKENQFHQRVWETVLRLSKEKKRGKRRAELEPTTSWFQGTCSTTKTTASALIWCIRCRCCPSSTPRRMFLTTRASSRLWRRPRPTSSRPWTTSLRRRRSWSTWRPKYLLTNKWGFFNSSSCHERDEGCSKNKLKI